MGQRRLGGWDRRVLVGFLAVAAMAGLGYLHYILWGQAMNQDVAEEQAQDVVAERDGFEQGVPRHAIRRQRF